MYRIRWRVGLADCERKRPLRERLGEDGTDALICLLNQLREKQRDDVLKILEEKFERRLAEELGKVRGEMAEQGAALRNEIAETRASLSEEIGRTSGSLRGEIAEARASLQQEIAETRASLRQEIAETGASLRSEMSDNVASLRRDIAEGRAELIKWMFVFWTGQLIAILGILFAFFK